jgi:hypothetical protein
MTAADCVYESDPALSLGHPGARPAEARPHRPNDWLSANAYVKNDRACARHSAQPPMNTGFCLVVRGLPRALG